MAAQVTIIWSPVEGVGRATVGVHLGHHLAAKGAITLLVDLNRYASALPYMCQNFSNKSIKNVYNSISKEDVFNNCSEVKGRSGFFTLNLSAADEIDALYRFSTDRVEQILRLCKEQVDQLLILMPSNYIETGFVAALAVDAENMLVVMNEDLSSWHRLKLYDNYFKELGVHMPRSLVVINKHMNMLSQDSYFKFNISLVEEHVCLPYLEVVRRYRNEGRVITGTLLKNKEEKRFCKGIVAIADFIGEKHEGSGCGE